MHRDPASATLARRRQWRGKFGNGTPVEPQDSRAEGDRMRPPTFQTKAVTADPSSVGTLGFPVFEVAELAHDRVISFK